jgi:hypothetical protein
MADRRRDMMPQHVIDVWDIGSFDPALLAFLKRHADLMRAFWKESRRLFDKREAETRRGIPEQNRHGPAFVALKEQATALMDARTIRCWHHSRLTDSEVAAIRAGGMQPMTLALIQARLDRAVGEGLFDAATAQALFAASPYHDRMPGNRENKIWLSTRPFHRDASAVFELFDMWGGESIAFKHIRGGSRALLRTIGRPRVIEVALPLAASTRTSSAAEDVVRSYGFALGCEAGWPAYSDMVVETAIPPAWILGIHSEGELSFASMARGYPPGFVGDDDD